MNIIRVRLQLFDNFKNKNILVGGRPIFLTESASTSTLKREQSAKTSNMRINVKIFQEAFENVKNNKNNITRIASAFPQTSNISMTNKNIDEAVNFKDENYKPKSILNKYSENSKNLQENFKLQNSSSNKKKQMHVSRLSSYTKPITISPNKTVTLHSEIINTPINTMTYSVEDCSNTLIKSMSNKVVDCLVMDTFYRTYNDNKYNNNENINKNNLVFRNSFKTIKTSPNTNKHKRNMRITFPDYVSTYTLTEDNVTRQTTISRNYSATKSSKNILKKNQFRVQNLYSNVVKKNKMKIQTKKDIFK